MTSMIIAMAFSEAADRLVVARVDGQIEAWRIGAPSTCSIVREHCDDPVFDLAGDGERVIGVANRRLFVWDEELELETEIALEHAVHSIALTDEGVWLAGDSHVVRFDRGFTDCSWSPIAEGRTTDFDVHPSGKRLIVVKDGLNARVHDTATGDDRRWSARVKLQHVSVRFADRADRLWIAANRDWELRQVSAGSGRALRTPKGEWRRRRVLPSAWAGPVALSPDRRYLAVLQTGRDVLVWDLLVDEPMFFAEPTVDRSQEKLFASLSRVPTFAQAGPGTVTMTTSRRQPNHDAQVTAIAIAERGTMVALGDRDGKVRRCDTRTGAIEELGVRELLAEPRCVAVVRWPGGVEHGVRDGEPWIAREGRLAKLDFERPNHLDGVVLEDFPVQDHTPGSPLLFFREDLVLRVVRDDTGPGIAAWEIATGRLAWRIETPGFAHFAGDVAYVAGEHTSWDRFPLWRIDLKTQRVDRLDDFTVDFAVADVSGSGRWPTMYTIGRHVVLKLPSIPASVSFLFEPERGVLKRRLVDGIDDGHDGRHALFQANDGYGLIDLDDPDAPAPFRTFTDPIRNVVWDREIGGDRALGWDRAAYRVVLASPRTGELLGHFAGHGTAPKFFCVSPDERTLLSCDFADFVRTWQLD